MLCLISKLIYMYHGLPLNSKTHTAFVKSLVYQITYYHIMFIVDTKKWIRHDRFLLKIHFHYVIKVFLHTFFCHFRELKLPEGGQTKEKPNPYSTLFKSRGAKTNSNSDSRLYFCFNISKASNSLISLY